MDIFKKKWFYLVLTLFFSGNLLASDESFENSLKDGKFSANLKLFYMVRTFDHKQADTKALNAGGILKYASGSFYNAKFGFAYYGSHKVSGIYSREQGIGTSLLQKNGDDIQFLGEAYLEYAIAKTTLKTGRQRLDTPLLEDNDQRLVPTVYEATIIRSQDIADTLLEVGYVTAYSGFASKYSGFDKQKSNWGEDGLAYIYLKNSSVKSLTLRAQFIKAISNSDSLGDKIKREDYQYIDLKYTLPIGSNTYIKAQYAGNNYIDTADSTLLGAKVGTSLSQFFDIAFMYDKISGNNLETIGSAPMYSDQQQGYGPYEPSVGVGAIVTFIPMQSLRIKTAYVHVKSDKADLIDDFSEYLVDLKYKINSYSKFRVRASFKDQSDASEKLLAMGNGGREDRKDIRFIYYINF